MRRFAFALAIAAAITTNAQETLDLAAIQQQAVDADPRIRQLELEAAQTTLRLRNIDAEKRPAIAVEGQAQYQSETVEPPFGPTPPKDTFDAALRVDHSLLDPTTKARRAAEQARLAEAQARIRTALFALRQEVNEAFFATALLQEREAQIANTITDLESRLREANIRVAEGVALPSESASIEATLLQRQQDSAELRAGRRGALARLAELTNRELTLDDRLVVPQLEAKYSEACANLGTHRARPEFAQFAKMRERLETQKQLVDASVKPRVSAYGKAGVGRPGLNFLSDELNPYWLAGIRVQWKPWTWGTDQRERELLDLQQQAVTADEEAFARTLRRTLMSDLATIDHLHEVSTSDDRIVALRESIERETGARYDEHVITAADYIDKQTDVLEARLLRATHRVQLAQAQARLLTLLGLEVQ